MRWCLSSVAIPPSRSESRNRLGFTVVELLLAVAILATIATIALPSYRGIVARGALSQATAELKALDNEILAFLATNRRLPPDLAAIGRDGATDPWGTPYQYLPFPIGIAPVDGSGKTKPPEGARKDRFLVPVNSDFDLYSKGPDGQSDSPFTAKISRDDVVRAGSGAFFGKAEDF